MRIFNQDKTAELTVYDKEKGKLVIDTLTHHFDEIKGITARERAEELKAEGMEVYEQDGVFYRVLAAYDNGGRDVEEIVGIENVPARDEVETIQVYIPYTEEELKERWKQDYRRKREPLLEAFDKWEKAVIRGRETDDTQVMAWYNDLKDLKPSALDNIPDRVQYYLKTE